MLVSDLTAEKLLKDYVCSGCWGNLQRFLKPQGKSEVICPKCSEDGTIETPGFVTRGWVDNQRSNSVQEKMEVEDLLIELGIIPPKPKKPVDQIMKELGF